MTFFQFFANIVPTKHIVNGDCTEYCAQGGDDDGNEVISGWYAYKYNEVYGQATIIDELPQPLITEKEIVDKNRDIDKCFEKCCCYVCE